jgi:hypothetical protein
MDNLRLYIKCVPLWLYVDYVLDKEGMTMPLTISDCQGKKKKRPILDLCTVRTKLVAILHAYSASKQFRLPY